jgi:uracil-DNA glycosylase family 4
MTKDTIAALNEQITSCRRCPRLVEYRERVARVKRRAFRDEVYWGRPLPGFGDPKARILIVGLAPAAHGGNRTGRVFTGDLSGDFLYAALYRAGFANQPVSTHPGDGLALTDVYIAAAVRCAPPDNKPLPVEFDNCHEYLDRELQLLNRLQTIVALGHVAFDTCLAAFTRRGIEIAKPRPKFGHNVIYEIGPCAVISSYHPSQRNTQTGLLTRPMFDRVFTRARKLIAQ